MYFITDPDGYRIEIVPVKNKRKKFKEIEKNLLTNRILSAIINEMPHREVQAPKGHHIWRVKIIGGATDVRNYCNRW